MELPCKTCGDVKPEAAFSSRQLKRAKTNDGGSCTACINAGDSGRRANPSRPHCSKALRNPQMRSAARAAATVERASADCTERCAGAGGWMSRLDLLPTSRLGPARAPI